VPDPARRYAERMLATAHLDVKWLAPPSADDIRARDQGQLVHEIGALTGDLADEDRAVARSLLGAHSAEDLVAALVHLRREARPAPEELTVPISMRPRREAPPPRARAERPAPREQAAREHAPREHAPREHAPREHAPREHAPREQAPRDHTPRERAPEREAAPEREGTWFTINVGRYKRADPKWLIPLLCRRGGVTKRDIGRIQVLARETRVEIATDVSERFAEAVRRPDPKDPSIHIEPLDAFIKS
jgi:ATP-dependent RNA helicase DeaD